MESKLLHLIAGTYSGSTLKFYTPQAGAQAGRPNTSLGAGNRPDVPQLLDGVWATPPGLPTHSRAIHTWSLHLYGAVLSVGWPWTLSGSSGCAKFLSSQRLRRTRVCRMFTPSWAHIFLSRTCCFLVTIPHTHHQVLLTQAHTEEVFRMLYASVLPQFIQL